MLLCKVSRMHKTWFGLHEKCDLAELGMIYSARKLFVDNAENDDVQTCKEIRLQGMQCKEVAAESSECTFTPKISQVGCPLNQLPKAQPVTQRAGGAEQGYSALKNKKCRGLLHPSCTARKSSTRKLAGSTAEGARLHRSDGGRLASREGHMHGSRK